MRGPSFRHLGRAMSLVALLILPVQAASPVAPGPGQPPPPPVISVDAEGKVLARPDMATLTLEVETQAPQAAAAAQENAVRTEALLSAVKKALGSEDTLRTLSFTLIPVYAAQDKKQPAEIRAYRASNRLQVTLKDLTRLGALLDTAWKNGASHLNGPFWGHSRLEELQQQAALDALGRAQRLAQALAQAAGLQLRGVERMATGVRPPVRPMAREAFLAPPGAGGTPVEVGEEEITASLQVVFRLGP